MSAKTEISNLPSLTSEGGLSVYLAQIKKFPILDAEEEYMLAKNWKERGNLKSAHKLVTSHLRLVAKIAMGYRGYGLPVNELISEGNIGLMQAVKKFDPEKGFRLATYAMWWIKAAIQEYVLRSWSLVKMGTTSAQKKLFFNLKKMKKQIAPYEEGDLKKEQVDQISKKLGVKTEEVVNMKDLDYYILFIDLDKMKQINDEYGHNMGDSALQETSKILKSSFREGDIISRYGGDEFIVFVSDVEDKVIDKIKSRIDKNVKLLNESKKFHYTLALTVGHSKYNSCKKESLDQVIERADENMYSKKGSKKK